jgi:hypothetical protein
VGMSVGHMDLTLCNDGVRVEESGATEGVAFRIASAV